MDGWTKDLTQIAVMFIAVAALALIVSHASGTSTVISSTTSGFGSLLSTVENPTGGSSSTSTASAAPMSFAQFSVPAAG